MREMERMEKTKPLKSEISRKWAKGSFPFQKLRDANFVLLETADSERD